MKKYYFLIMIVLGFISCKKEMSYTTTTPTTTEVDVYVAGWEFNWVVNVAKYWKNGEAIALGDGINGSEANSIVVVGSDVYVAGESTNSGFRAATYWKNGQAIALSDGTVATSIAL